MNLHIDVKPDGTYDLCANSATTLLVLLARGKGFRMWLWAKSERERGIPMPVYSEEIDHRLIEAAAETLAERIDRADDGGAL